MKNLLVIALVFLWSVNAFCQSDFVTSGSIEYERNVNTYALIKKMLGKDPLALDVQKFEQFKKTQPQFKILKSMLIFEGNKTLFAPAAEEVVVSSLFNIPMTSQNSIVYTNRQTQKSIVQKSLFDETFLLKDSIRKINWKITDETREVAGYTCRRANALILDSVYVVAFYIDEIHVSSGPELFNGLPGMILELALPHDNVSWRATKVTLAPPLSGKTVEPARGKLISLTEFNKLLISLFGKRDNAETAKIRIKEYSF